MKIYCARKHIKFKDTLSKAYKYILYIAYLNPKEKEKIIKKNDIKKGLFIDMQHIKTAATAQLQCQYQNRCVFTIFFFAFAQMNE